MVNREELTDDMLDEVVGGLRSTTKGYHNEKERDKKVAKNSHRLFPQPSDSMIVANNKGKTARA